MVPYKVATSECHSFQSNLNTDASNEDKNNTASYLKVGAVAVVVTPGSDYQGYLILHQVRADGSPWKN